METDRPQMKVQKQNCYNCPHCQKIFNESDRIALIICESQHLCCLPCLQQILFNNRVPICACDDLYVSQKDSKNYQMIEQIRKLLIYHKNTEDKNKVEKQIMQNQIKKIKAELTEKNNKINQFEDQTNFLKKQISKEVSLQCSKILSTYFTKFNQSIQNNENKQKESAKAIRNQITSTNNLFKQLKTKTSEQYQKHQSWVNDLRNQSLKQNQALITNKKLLIEQKQQMEQIRNNQNIIYKEMNKETKKIENMIISVTNSVLNSQNVINHKLQESTAAHNAIISQMENNNKSRAKQILQYMGNYQDRIQQSLQKQQMKANLLNIYNFYQLNNKGIELPIINLPLTNAINYKDFGQNLKKNLIKIFEGSSRQVIQYFPKVQPINAVKYKQYFDIQNYYQIIKIQKYYNIDKTYLQVNRHRVRQEVQKYQQNFNRANPKIKQLLDKMNHIFILLGFRLQYKQFQQYLGYYHNCRKKYIQCQIAPQFKVKIIKSELIGQGKGLKLIAIQQNRKQTSNKSQMLLMTNIKPQILQQIQILVNFQKLCLQIQKINVKLDQAKKQQRLSICIFQVLNWNLLDYQINKYISLLDISQQVNPIINQLINKQIKQLSLSAYCQNYYQFLIKQNYRYQIQYNPSSYYYTHNSNIELFSLINKLEFMNIPLIFDHAVVCDSNQLKINQIHIGFYYQELKVVSPKYKMVSELQIYLDNSRKEIKSVEFMSTDNFRRFIYQQLFERHSIYRLYDWVQTLVQNMPEFINSQNIKTIIQQVNTKIAEFNDQLSVVCYRLTSQFVKHTHLFTIYMMARHCSSLTALRGVVMPIQSGQEVQIFKYVKESQNQTLQFYDQMKQYLKTFKEDIINQWKQSRPGQIKNQNYKQIEHQVQSKKYAASNTEGKREQLQNRELIKLDSKEQRKSEKKEEIKLHKKDSNQLYKTGNYHKDQLIQQQARKNGFVVKLDEIKQNGINKEKSINKSKKQEFGESHQILAKQSEKLNKVYHCKTDKQEQLKLKYESKQQLKHNLNPQKAVSNNNKVALPQFNKLSPQNKQKFNNVLASMIEIFGKQQKQAYHEFICQNIIMWEDQIIAKWINSSQID